MNTANSLRRIDGFLKARGCPTPRVVLTLANGEVYAPAAGLWLPCVRPDDPQPHHFRMAADMRPGDVVELDIADDGERTVRGVVKSVDPLSLKHGET